MANITTVTRPYAKAILALALAQRTTAEWSQMLQFLAAVVQDAEGLKFISNLAISSNVKAEFICDLAPQLLNEQGRTLVKILARGKRLLIIPELFNMYENLRKQAAGQVTLHLMLAVDTDAETVGFLQEMYKQKTKAKEVILYQNIESSLIAGAVAQIGNRVIDDSFFGRLHAMHNFLKN